MNSLLFVFKQQLEGNELPEEIKQIAEQIMQSEVDTISIQNGKWKAMEMSEFSCHIAEWNNRKFFFRRNPQPKILKQISSIKFNKISLLAIQDNLIQSLQQISEIWMPNLSSLGIERNKVKSLKCMRKAYIQNFRHFGIAGNKILDCEEITRLQSTSLSMIGIQTKGLKQQSPDIRWFAKLQTKNLTHSYFRSPNRIKSYTQKIIKTIQKKHLSIDARFHDQDQERGMNLRI